MESLNAVYRPVAKLNAGPGGWKCPCCNPYRRPARRMKALAHRIVRRKGKQAARSVEE